MGRQPQHFAAEARAERHCSGRRVTLRLVEVVEQLDQRAHPEAGAAARHEAVVGVGQRRPGEVDVHPRHVGHELLEEEARSERASAAATRAEHGRAADVLQVGHGRVEQPPVLDRQRERPHELVRPFGGPAHLAQQVVVVAHHAGDAVAERARPPRR